MTDADSTEVRSSFVPLTGGSFSLSIENVIDALHDSASLYDSRVENAGVEHIEECRLRKTARW